MRHIVFAAFFTTTWVLSGCSGGSSSGEGDGPPPPVPPSASCRSTGSDCASDADCCGDCFYGFCSQSTLGGKCATTDDCESPYLCVSYVCATASCRQDADVCTSDGQCCGANCRGDGTCGANRPPVAGAGPDATMDRGITTSLGGTSSDPDGDPLAYSWTLARPAGSGATLTGASTAHPTLTPDVAGDYTVTVTVSDGLASASDTAVLTAVNAAPVAHAGADRSVARNQVALLDATGSTDPNGDPLTYTWTLTAPPGSGAALSSATDPKPTFIPDLLGAYVLTLVASDGWLTASTSVTLTAINTPPVPQVTGFALVNAGEGVTLSAATSSDPNGDPLSFTWTLSPPTGSATTLTATAGPTTSFVTDLEGPYVVTLTASDGMDGASATFQVNGSHRVFRFPHDVVDAAYAKDGDRVVMISSSPRSSVWILDPATEAEVELPLPGGPPLAVSVSADGSVAAVGRLGAVTAVGLASGTLTKDCAITWVNGGGTTLPFEAASVATDVVNVGTLKSPNLQPFAYVVSGTSPDGGDGTVSVNLTTCATTVTAGVASGVPKAVAIRPKSEFSYRRLYLLSEASANSSILYDIETGPAASPWVMIDGTEPDGRRLWFLESGSLFVSSTGDVFESDPAGAGWLYDVGDLAFPGIADGRAPVAHAVGSSALFRITIVPGQGIVGGDPAWLDLTLRHYVFYTPYPSAGETTLPPFVTDGVAVTPRARFAFYRSDASKLYVIQRTALDVTPAVFGFSALAP